MMYLVLQCLREPGAFGDPPVGLGERALSRIGMASVWC
jgi:hypothetical protein